MQTEIKCWYCHNTAAPDPDGNCPTCRRQVTEAKKDVTEKIQFYCVVCDEFFFSKRDDTGFDQAPCIECGDLSNTPEFHAEQMFDDDSQPSKSAAWIVWLIFGSGIGWFFIRRLFGL